ncbi:hypothetical protein DSO57_1039161 [Entomophthora muscae]|uniref:Uncharacterized protein n=2 Tax=Entomophthora muscae TaxID=34485 RepID=A0ACC2UKH5_9FUNG|nr:hypothetical protein DSO57_1037290 [Entomophthora muscae]KAJ9086867.1 hypothetical protein DSO57_1039161 [Entomophthora muscae]
MAFQARPASPVGVQLDSGMGHGSKDVLLDRKIFILQVLLVERAVNSRDLLSGTLSAHLTQWATTGLNFTMANHFPRPWLLSCPASADLWAA